MALNLVQYRDVRQKCRTSLRFLCHILGYVDVCREVHGKLIDSLQKFKGGTEEFKLLAGGRFGLTPNSFKPFVEMWDLEGPRKSLVLIPRGHLKSSVATMAHTIQWIINYPNIRILLSSGTGDQVRGFLSETKEHFQFNEKFRYYFPEFCPHGKGVKDFGNQDEFTVPCRTVHRKEPTVATCSVGAVVAGGHFDVIKNDDIVDKENVRTPEQILNVNSHYGFLWPLLETCEKAPFKGWMDVIGTRYSFSDLYGNIIDGEAESPQGWTILQQDAIVEGELSMEPCMADCEIKKPHPIITHCKSLWPSRVPPQALLDILNDPLQGPEKLASQYRMNPIPEKSGLISNKDELVWIPRKELDDLLPRLTQRVTIDLAGMEPATNKMSDLDFTVINHHGFSRDGRLYVNRLWRGRFTPFEVIEIIFKISRLYPRVLEFKVSKDHFYRVLMPFLKREQQKRQMWIPITPAKIDNNVSKPQKIKGLQPWFRMKSIILAQDLDCKLAVINEIMRFPKFSHDDILDTICDALFDRDGNLNNDVTGRPKTEIEVREQGSPLPEALTWAILQGQQTEQETQYDLITGW